MILVGLTGGIGSGKSTVAGLLAGRGAVVIDFDEIARQVAAPDGASYHALVRHFGVEVVSPDGTLDRSALAAKVFADPAELAMLNAITHPAIAREAVRRIAELSDLDGIVVLEIPLLDEARCRQWGLAGVVVVDVPVEVAIDRLVRFRGFSRSDARARVEAQAGREERLRLADVVIDNSGSRADLDAAMGRVWVWLEGLPAAPRPRPPG